MKSLFQYQISSYRISMICEGKELSNFLPSKKERKKRKQAAILRKILSSRFVESVVFRKVERLELLAGKTILPYLKDEMEDQGRFLIQSIKIRSRHLLDPDFFKLLAYKICKICDAIAYARIREISTAEPHSFWHKAEPEELGNSPAERHFDAIRPHAELVADYKAKLEALRIYWKASNSRKAKAGLKGDIAFLKKAFQVSIGHGLSFHAGKCDYENSALRKRKFDFLNRISEGNKMLESMAKPETLSFDFPLVMGEHYISRETLTRKNPDLDFIVSRVKANFARKGETLHNPRFSPVLPTKGMIKAESACTLSPWIPTKIKRAVLVPYLP